MVVVGQTLKGATYYGEEMRPPYDFLLPKDLNMKLLFVGRDQEEGTTAKKGLINYSRMTCSSKF